MRPFRLSDPLPSGTTVLEASAGTGKTYAIAALAARFLAEGRASIDDLLLVTFSRAATAELRSRVRDRLQSSASALRAVLEGGAAVDEVDRLLADASTDEVAARADRLDDALVHFDAATIMTTHEFCHGMLRGLGVLAAQEPTSTLVEDLIPLADEAAADVYLARYAFAPRVPPFPFSARRSSFDTDADAGARSIARDAVTTDAVLGPPDADGAVAERVAFAEQVRAEVATRKAQRRLFSFDDQLTRLRDALADPQTGELARAKLAARFPVVLIDEFQDTDPVQWQIIRAAFGSPASTLVLIGDPKQAIYSFRGGDVHTYSAAARSASVRTTLTRNFRSDAPVVAAIGKLFEGVLVGDDIAVPPVDAHQRASRLVARPETPWAAGVQVRVLPGDEPTTPWAAATEIERDLVGVVQRLIAPGSPLSHPGGEPLRASDIAVLVRTNRRGADVARALNAAGIAATFSGTNSVFASDAAADWLTLLTALEATRRPFVQRAILTDFVGGTLAELATADDARWADWSVWLHGWSRVLRRSGVPALLAALDRDTAFTARLLAREGGERLVTDHRHIAELLHGAQLAGASTVRELVEWLDECVREARASSERTRRLETDEAAVQIMTIHRAKGLQFPVVLLPEAARDNLRSADEGHKIVLPLESGRALDVGGRLGPGRPERWRRQQTDDADESLRSLYVGMTRAESHVILWWANHRDTPSSPLHRLLHADHHQPPTRPALHYVPHPDGSNGSPLGLAWLAEAGIGVALADGAPKASPRGDARRTPGPLAARPWTRTIDEAWRRTSYSGLTAGAHEVETPLLADEPDQAIAVDADEALALPSPMALLPGGAAFGTLVHSVYEHLDARGADWRDVLAREVRAAVRRWPVPGVAVDDLAVALQPTLETPLGPLAPGVTLRSFGPSDRLAELDFEFALDAPDATLADVAALLARHLPPDHALADYPSRLTGPLTLQRLHGFLTGSIDAVLRLPDGGHLIVDYKTNRLGTPGAELDELTVGHYAPRPMAEAMMASHYPLQALLYSVALHRFLAARLAGYDPERHLAGSLYLFVRGMAGPATPLVDGHPTGVFSWRPAPELVVALSRLLGGRR